MLFKLLGLSLDRSLMLADYVNAHIVMYVTDLSANWGFLALKA